MEELDLSRHRTFTEKSEAEWLGVGLEQKWVYVAGPVSKGNWMHNLRDALDAGEELISAGFLPIIPHTLMLIELVHPHNYKVMLYRLTLPMIARSDYVLRIPGESYGADIEDKFAKSRGIPVYYSMVDFLEEHGHEGIGMEWA